MTLRHLKIFEEVCRNGSITMAADQLNMAQPAVSYAIRELESYYEIKLFERMNRRLYITDAGRQLLIYADSILTQVNEVKNVLKDVDSMTEIRLGTNVSFSISGLVELLSGFFERYPKISIYTQVQNSTQIEDLLMRNELDFGIIDYPVNSENFVCRMLVKDTMAAACAVDLEVESQLAVENLDSFPFLMREKGSGSRKMIDRLFEGSRSRPRIVMESVNAQSLIDACLKGMGILILPESVLKPYIEEGRLREIKIMGTNFVREYYLVYHKSKFLTKSMKYFREYTESLY